MSNCDKDQVNERAFLGRGVFRTLRRDIMAIALGVVIGAVIGFVVAYILGYSSQFGIKFGAVVGAFIGLAARTHLSSLFDYDHLPRDKSPDA